MIGFGYRVTLLTFTQCTVTHLMLVTLIDSNLKRSPQQHSERRSPRLITTTASYPAPRLPLFSSSALLARGRKGRIVLLSHVLKCFYKRGLLWGSKFKRLENFSVHLIPSPLFYKWGNGDFFLWAIMAGGWFCLLSTSTQDARNQGMLSQPLEFWKGLKLGSDLL